MGNREGDDMYPTHTRWRGQTTCQVRDGTVCEGWTVVRWEIRKANNMEMMLNQLALENAPCTHTLEGPDDMPGKE